MAAALEQAREVELEGHCWCLSGAAPRRFASVGVMRPSEPPAARVSRCLRRPASLLWVAIGCPQRPSLVALGSASFRRRVRPDGCVVPLRSRSGGGGSAGSYLLRIPGAKRVVDEYVVDGSFRAPQQFNCEIKPTDRSTPARRC